MYTVLGSLYISVFKAVHPFSFSIVYSISFNNIAIRQERRCFFVKNASFTSHFDLCVQCSVQYNKQYDVRQVHWTALQSVQYIVDEAVRIVFLRKRPTILMSLYIMMYSTGYIIQQSVKYGEQYSIQYSVQLAYITVYSTLSIINLNNNLQETGIKVYLWYQASSASHFDVCEEYSVMYSAKYSVQCIIQNILNY